jgi:hypothetical protein
LTLGEWVAEYLEAHQGERVTVSKLRWLLGKATAELGGVRLAELSPEQVCAWRLTIPEGHRFEATQALRQVLNRAVAWRLIEENPAKRGVPNPGRRCREQRPFESWAQIRSYRSGSGRGLGRWSCSRPRPGSGRQSCSRSSRVIWIAALASSMSDARTRTDESASQDPAEQTRGSVAGDRA